MVVDYINQANEKGLLFVTQRRGVITLIPKNGDQTLPANKRAICLWDVIYKILAKVLSNRLMSVLHKIVSSDQGGSTKERYIVTNIKTIVTIVTNINSIIVTNIRTTRINIRTSSVRTSYIIVRLSILMALDFRNGFNSVDLSFVYQTLRYFNFGDSFISWVQLLHRNSEIAIINNGYTFQWFKPTRGLQQG